LKKNNKTRNNFFYVFNFKICFPKSSGVGVVRCGGSLGGIVEPSSSAPVPSSLGSFIPSLISLGSAAPDVNSLDRVVPGINGPEDISLGTEVVTSISSREKEEEKNEDREGKEKGLEDGVEDGVEEGVEEGVEDDRSVKGSSVLKQNRLNISIKSVPT